MQQHESYMISHPRRWKWWLGHSKKRWICHDLSDSGMASYKGTCFSQASTVRGEFLMFRPQSWPRWSAAPDGFVWKSCAPKSTGLSLVYLVNYTMFAILIAVTGGCTAFSGTTRKQSQMFSTRSISCLWRSSKNHSANCHWPWQLEISLGREGLGGKGIVLYWSSDGEWC